MAPNIAFPEFNFYDLICLTRKLAVNAELLGENCILAIKNRQKFRTKRPEQI